MGPFVAQSLAAIIANLTTFSGGIILGWSSPSLPKLLNPDDKDDLKLTSDEVSWVVSVTSFGSIFGPIIFNLFVDRFGRKWSLKLVMLPMLASWLTMGLTASVEALYVSRFLGGIGIGAVCALMPMYLGEIAEDRISGALGTLMMTSFAAGTLFAVSIGPWITRKMFCVACAVPPLLFLGLSWRIPETPYFLLMKGDNEKAQASLAWLRGRTYVDAEITALQTNVIEEQKLRDGFGTAELFRSRINRRALGITSSLITVEQLSGIIAITSYNRLIFDSSGLNGWNELSAIIMGIVRIIGGISVIFVVDSAGRRLILMLSAITISLALTCEGAFFHLKTIGYDTTTFAWAPLLGIIVFYFSFVPGISATSHAMIGEMFPTNVKAPASMFLSVYSSALEIVVAKGYQVVGDAVGTQWVFYFFAATTLAGAMFVYLFVPETKKLSLQAIQEKLSPGTIRTKNAPPTIFDS